MYTRRREENVYSRTYHAHDYVMTGVRPEGGDGASGGGKRTRLSLSLYIYIYIYACIYIGAPTPHTIHKPNPHTK
jgi:hypothetical protein